MFSNVIGEKTGLGFDSSRDWDITAFVEGIAWLSCNSYEPGSPPMYTEPQLAAQSCIRLKSASESVAAPHTTDDAASGSKRSKCS